MHKQIIAIVLTSLLISFSAGASYTAEVGCITPSEYEGVENLGENLAFGIETPAATPVLGRQEAREDGTLR